MKKQFLILPLIIFLSILLIFFYLLIVERNPSDLPSSLINKKVPIFKSEYLLEKKAFISSNEFKGEITLVNFFATWCYPCRLEHNFIKLLANKNGVKIIGINYKDNSKETVEWLKELGNPYSSIATDQNGRIAIEWGVYGIPETFIVDSNGIVKYRHPGPITNKSYDKIVLKINEIK